MPPLVKVTAGRLILAATLEKLSVKLRSAVSEPRLVGEAAAALVLLRLKSWTLPSVAPEAKVIAPLILLAWSRIILEAAVFSVKVKTPVAELACVIAPTSEILPLAAIFKAPVPTEEAPSDKALPLVKDTALLLELFKETAPVKLLPVFARVSTPALAVKLAAPALAA